MKQSFSLSGYKRQCGLIAAFLICGWSGECLAYSLHDCLAQVEQDPQAALDDATDWHNHDGGVQARQCLAAAEKSLGFFSQAALEFETLAHLPFTSAKDRAERTANAFQSTQAYMGASDYGHACAVASFGESLDPSNTGMKIEYARALLECDGSRQAVVELSPAAEKEITSPLTLDALTLRASAYRRLSLLPAASQDLQRVLGQEPENIDALLERGIVRAQSGDLAGARSDWEKVTSLAPDTHQANLASQDLAVAETDPDVTENKN